ncbi:LOW QUALITY PROTEIN: 17-beta-hydroxysteroid dehydrogenase type 6-like [Arvicola amphibius]|uniref:LOW QUALITY PROTEIN: 17-beta-hydroxysteroid dehydrogenase type 6-like n=1 Tax=Arvicola amphibius TaxID=1047088 RepID=UPI001C0816AA|nr:LOW QUALITY PROTEIN: 17-beta-hydroxysteroid dehydrogenase type 6-like [Arvicola amphibius]
MTQVEGRGQLEIRDSTPEERSGLKSEIWGHLILGQDDDQDHQTSRCLNLDHPSLLQGFTLAHYVDNIVLFGPKIQSLDLHSVLLGLWGLVNNAAVFPTISYIEWLKPEDYMSVFQVNLVGLAQVTLSMLFLVKKAQGRTVNVSSVLGRVAFFGGFYSCSKYGVEAFSDILRCEVQDFGVKVSIIEPGSFKTGTTDPELTMERGSKKAWEAAPEHVKESYGQQFFDDFYRVTKQNLMISSTNLNLVTDCMEHALTSTYPRTRYSACWDAQFIFITLSYLPTSLADYILTRSRPKPAQAA